jgi:hypothetical protein
VKNLLCAWVYQSLNQLVAMPNYRDQMKDQFKNGCCQIFRTRLLSKPLHGQFLANLHENHVIDSKLSFCWLSSPSLKAETEGFRASMQDQAVATRYYKAKIIKIRDTDDKRRFCGQEPETIHHLLSSCQPLAGSLYVDRHNNVAKYIHWCVC